MWRWLRWPLWVSLGIAMLISLTVFAAAGAAVIVYLLSLLGQ